MIITVRIHPNSSLNRIEEIAENCYSVYTSAQPHENKANEALIKILANHFKVAQTLITIIKGQKTKTKIIRINP